jgi:hypothetical protein
MEDIAPMIATIVMLIMIGWIVKVVSQNKRFDKMARMHNDLQTRMIDKFSSNEELLAYLATDPGKRLLDAPVIERGTPYARILGSVQAGIVLTVAGLAFLLMRNMITGLDDTSFAFTGVLALALGIGFVVSAWASHALSKSYGLINGDRLGDGQ